MKIEIRDSSTGKTVYTTEVFVSGLNYVPSQEEGFNEAWRAAVEDGAVKPTEKGKYKFELVGGANKAG